MNKTCMHVAVAILLGIANIQSTALAKDICPGRDYTNEQTNAEFKASGTSLVVEALKLAKAGNGPETKATAKASLIQFKCIVNTTKGAQMQRPTTRVRKAAIVAGKGRTEEAAALLTEALVMLAETKLELRGMFDGKSDTPY